tara:strand:- start:297 stop:434 length:138 start_codon:yes stop_codon:yes gene_type:complete
MFNMLLSLEAVEAMQQEQDLAVAEQVVTDHQFQANHQVVEHPQNL